jgi:hypothetical protein
MMMQKMCFGEYTLEIFLIGFFSNTAIGIILSEPIIDNNVEVDVQENFLILIFFAIDSLSKTIRPNILF